MILHDGGLASLVATIVESERAAASKSMAPPVLWCDASGPMAEAVRRQAGVYGLEVVEGRPYPVEVTGEGERLTLRLLAAGFDSARLGCTRVVWPVQLGGAEGDGPDLDDLACHVDRALLVSRLIGLEARTHGSPGIEISTPLLDISDAQLADLAMDMAAPVQACWWYEAGMRGEEPARAELDRWTPRLKAFGWVGG